MEDRRDFRTFLALWATQSVSVLGSSLTFFTLSLWLSTVLYPALDQRAQLATSLSAISLAHILPTLAVSPIAGVLADRHDRKRIMFWSNLGSALTSAMLALLLFTGNLRFGYLLFLTVVSSTLSSLHSSAFDTSYAMVVPDDLLPRANGMMQTMWSMAGVLSPALATIIIALPSMARQGAFGWLSGSFLAGLQSGAPLVVSIDAITFLIAALVLPYLNVPSPQKRELISLSKKPSIIAEVIEGLRYIWLRRPLLWLLITFAVFNFLTGPLGILQPLVVKFNLAADWTNRGFTFETAMAMLSTMSGLGGIAGGFLISIWGGLKAKRVYGVIVPMVLFGVVLLGFGLSPFVYLSAGLLLLLNSLGPILNAHSQSIWQRQTPKEMQGRVFAVRRLIAQISYPLATALTGWAAGRLNPGGMAAVLGSLAALFAGAQLLNKSLMRAEDRDYLESLASTQGKARSLSS